MRRPTHSLTSRERIARLLRARCPGASREAALALYRNLHRRTRRLPRVAGSARSHTPEAARA